MRVYGDAELAILQTKNEIKDLMTFIHKSVDSELDPVKDKKLIMRVVRIHADYERILAKFKDA